MPKIALLLTVVGLVCCAGCGKTPVEGSSEPSPSAASESAAASSHGEEPGLNHPPFLPAEAVAQLPVPSAPPPQHVAARADNVLRMSVVGDVDPSLSHQLRVFVEKNKRLPESFAEFALTRLDSIPRPPEGKRWVIDVQNLQVKAVAGQ